MKGRKINQQLKGSNLYKKNKADAYSKAVQKLKKQKAKKSPKNKKVSLPGKKRPLFKGKSLWRAPSLLIVVSLMIIILIVPTLIVAPYIHEGDKTNVKALNDHQETSTSPFSVEVMRTDQDKVEKIPLENYVVGVVASEMPATFEEEALKAQALAARTYIVNHLLYNKSENESSDVTDSVQHQVYKSNEELKGLWGPKEFDEKINKIKKAVHATEGEILTYEEEPITPAFFSTSNGYTENSEDYWDNELPYLRSVTSKWDESSPKFLDQKIFTKDELESALEVSISAYDAVPIEVSRTESNRVDKIQIGDKEYSGRAVREKLDLQSSDFTIKQNNDHFIFKTKGYGHGIGMSQYGANGMAKEGKSYEEIVKYFYQDIEINHVPDVAPTLVAK